MHSFQEAAKVQCWRLDFFFHRTRFIFLTFREIRRREETRMFIPSNIVGTFCDLNLICSAEACRRSKLMVLNWECSDRLMSYFLFRLIYLFFCWFFLAINCLFVQSNDFLTFEEIKMECSKNMKNKILDEGLYYMIYIKQ